MAAEGSRKTILAAMLANFGIAIAKFIAFLVTSSASMLAESIHSVADTSNQGLLLLGGKRAEKDPSEIHPFGYGRERYFWSFVVSLVLFSLGGVFATFEGIEKIREPQELQSVAWAIGVLVLGLVLEGSSFRTAVHESRPIKGDRSWPAFIREARTPELVIVLLEDAGAQIGLGFALIGVGLSTLTDNPVWDGIGTLSIGILLIGIALVLTIEMKSLLIGEAATADDRDALAAAVTATAHVERLIHMRTQHLSPDELLVSAKLEIDGHLSVDEAADVIDDAEAAMRKAVPAARFIFLEPDTYDADTANADPSKVSGDDDALA